MSHLKDRASRQGAKLAERAAVFACFAPWREIKPT